MRREARKSKKHARANFAETQIREVMQFEKDVWKAARDRNAEDFAKLVPADALMIFQSGIVTQPNYLAGMQRRSIQESRIEDLRGYMPNATTVILTYKTVRSGNYEGKPFPATPVIESTTWIRRGKRWVAVLNQETALSE